MTKLTVGQNIVIQARESQLGNCNICAEQKILFINEMKQN
jgi:hypothetical protein